MGGEESRECLDSGHEDRVPLEAPQYASGLVTVRTKTFLLVTLRMTRRSVYLLFSMTACGLNTGRLETQDRMSPWGTFETVFYFSPQVESSNRLMRTNGLGNIP